MNLPVLCIAGPTGSGKTAAALSLASAARLAGCSRFVRVISAQLLIMLSS